MVATSRCNNIGACFGETQAQRPPDARCASDYDSHLTRKTNAGRRHSFPSLDCASNSDNLELSEQLLHGLLLRAADRDAPRICRRFKSSQLTVQQAWIHVFMVPFPDAFFEQAARSVQQRKADLIGFETCN